MSVAEVRNCSTSDAMKPQQEILKLEKEGRDSPDNTISQEIGREPFLSFSRTGESSFQWIQLLHALDQQGSNTFSTGTKVDNGIGGKERGLDHFNGVGAYSNDMNLVKESVRSLNNSGLPAKGPKSTSQQMQTLNIPEAVVAFVQAAAKANGEPEKYLPGWPLLSPSKVQLQKCDKCSREFCSTINYRRHIRVHRRSLNIDKDSPKNRGLLGIFWDKLSLDDEKEILSLENVAIEGVTGSSLIRALASLIRKPGLFSLPEAYVKAGMTLLDLIQARPARLPILSNELFDLLDDASENTFLCAGTALSTQKFVFDGETEKIALEMKNLIACAGFMIEQKMVKAWLTDKDIEALRCQKLLVEEEEAAQKRQAELLERRRLKKLRQKQQKEKESTEANRTDTEVCSPQATEETSGSTGIPSPRSPSESGMNTTEMSFDEDLVFPEPTREPGSDTKANFREHMHTVDADQSLERLVQGRSQQAATNSRLHLRAVDVDENVDPRFQMGTGQRQPIVTRWPAPNPTRNAHDGSHSVQVLSVKSSSLMKHGSYRDPKAVTLANGHKVWTRKIKPENKEKDTNDGGRVEREIREQKSDKCEVLIGSINVRLGNDNGDQLEIIPPSSSFQHKLAKYDSSLDIVNRSAVKLWKPVGRRHSEEPAPTPSDKRQTKAEESAPTPSDIREIKTDGSCAEPAACNPLDERHPHSGVGNNFSESFKDSSTVPGSSDLIVPDSFSRHDAEAFLAQRWKEAVAGDHVVLTLSLETETSDCHNLCESNPGETTVESSDCSEKSSTGSAPNRFSETGPSEPAGASKPTNFIKLEKSYRLKYVPKQRNNG